MWLYLFWLVALGRWFPMKGQVTTDAQEYQQYKTMAEYSMTEGDYEKARKLWRICLTLPKYENDTKAQQKADDCTKIIAAQQHYQKALNGEEDIMPAFRDLLKLQPISPQDKFFKTRITQQIEQTADKYLKEGNVEQATKLFGYAYEMTPVVGLAFKLEQADMKYVEKYQRNSLPYTNYKQKKNTPQNNTNSLLELDEYAQIIKSADEALKNGNYDLARRKYSAATQVPGHENDHYADEQRLRITRLQQINKRLEETQNDPRGQLIYARDALSLSPDDATLRPKAAKAAVQVGDEMLSKELFADAKRYYQEAARYGANGMNEKIADTENKIKAKRQENAKKQVEVAKQKGKKQPNLQPAKEPKPRREMPTLVGVAITAGASAAFPILNNGSSNIKTPISLQWYGGGHLIVLPDGKFSPIVGVHYAPVRFQTAAAAKTIPLERFAFDLLQIPVGLRYKYPMSNQDLSIHFEAGATFNLPRKLNYTNYAVEINNTDLNMLNNQTLGFYGGIGMSKYLSKRRSVSLMLQYQRTDNLLNLDYKDNATNRSRASMLLQGLSVQLIFRVF
ncbi:hypothetical protein FHS57_006048 [Runella defluvii]|uniref:Uncharacterized protein n=2 Tax=Runella defluvii TaxID=370973 RepID=A0A7W5ZRX6_9BACT|nr:hypothetical protein [Runella defluvii]